MAGIADLFKFKDKRVDLPPGEHFIDDEIVLPHVSGGVVSGHGSSETIWPGHPMHGPVTRLVPRRLPKGKPMFRYTGAELKFENICFDGLTRLQREAKAERPDLCFLLTRQPGLGTGGLTFENVYFNSWKTAMQIGQKFDESNCERCTYRKVRYYNCDTAVRGVTMQGMGHNWYDPEFGGCGICVDMLGGGRYTFQNPLVLSNGVFLNFRKPAKQGEWAIGPNNGVFRVSGLVLDNYCTDLVLVKMEPGGFYLSDILFDQLGHAQLECCKNEPAFQIADFTSLTCRDFYGLKPEWFTWDCPPNTASRIMLDNCRLNNVPRMRAMFKGKGTCYLHTSNCYDYQNRPVGPNTAWEI